ncbi:MAG: Fic family protein [Candidatus Paceibacterota bacterium]
MFNPRYSISPKLLENIKRIAALTSELNNRAFPKLITLEMERSARALSAYSSTSIEGNPLPLTEVKKLLKHSPKNLRDTEKEVLNYNATLEYLDRITKSKKLDISLSFILTVQKMVTEGLIENHRSGKIRNEPVFVNDPRTRRTVYLPPETSDVPALLDELIGFALANEGVLDPLIIAGIFHKQFVIIHPFVDGNGRTARLTSKSLLASMGLDTFNLFSFENYYNKNVSNYFQKVGLFGNYYELKEVVDFTEWLEYFTDGIIDELLRVKKELEKSSLAVEPRINIESSVVIDYLNKHGSINEMEYSTISKRAKSTRALDFRKMVDQGIIDRFGKGRNTFYRLKK